MRTAVFVTALAFTFLLLFLVIWFAQQALFGYFDLINPVGEGGGVAYFAHIGGFVFGFLAIRAFARRRKAASRPRLGY